VERIGSTRAPPRRSPSCRQSVRIGHSTIRSSAAKSRRARRPELPLPQFPTTAETEDYADHRHMRRRGAATGDPGLPPSQYDAGDIWSVLHAERLRQPHRWLDLHDRRRGDSGHHVELGGDPGASRIPLRGHDPLRHHTVRVPHEIRRCLRRYLALEVAGPLDTAAFVRGSLTYTGYITDLPIEAVTDDKAWVIWAVDRAPAAGIHGRPAPLLVPHPCF